MEQPAWAWGIAGMILLMLELLSTSFFFMWFGIAALCVAVLLFLFPLPLAAQFFFFAVLSVGSLTLWRRNYKPGQPELRIGQAQDDTIGKTGHIIEAVSPEQNGRIAFTVPVMGCREWAAISDESIAAGEPVEVVAIVGNFLRVRRKPAAAHASNLPE